MRRASPAPILVLGLGNLLLRDDGVGLELLKRLEERFGDDPRIDFVDGGTKGIELLGVLEGRRAILFLDARGDGRAPGSVTLNEAPLQIDSGSDGADADSMLAGAHAANATGLLRAASLIGTLPEQLALIGVTPKELHTEMGLSSEVEAALPTAIEKASTWLLAQQEAPQ